MIRLFVLIWYVLILGRRPPKALPPPKECARSSRHANYAPAAVYCEHDLCTACCETRCECLDHQIAETKDQRRLLAGIVGIPG